MITSKEAYEIIKKEHENDILVGCLEYPDFFGFGFIIKGQENDLPPGGRAVDIVVKETGKIDKWVPIQDLSLLIKAKEVDIKELL